MKEYLGKNPAWIPSPQLCGLEFRYLAKFRNTAIVFIDLPDYYPAFCTALERRLNHIYKRLRSRIKKLSEYKLQICQPRYSWAVGTNQQHTDYQQCSAIHRSLYKYSYREIKAV